MDLNITISAATLGAGVIMLFFSLRYFFKRRSAFQFFSGTTGTVRALKSTSSTFMNTTDGENMAFREEENMFKGAALAPVIEFKTKDGRVFEYTGSASKPPRYKIGDTVEILYPEAKPEKAITNSFVEKWLLAIFLITFSSIVIITGGLVLFLL